VRRWEFGEEVVVEKEGESPSPRVSSNPPPSAQRLLLTLPDLLCLVAHQRSHLVYYMRLELAILTGLVLGFHQGVWQFLTLFLAAPLLLELEVLGQRCTRVAPGQRLSEEVEGLFEQQKAALGGRLDQGWFALVASTLSLNWCSEPD